MWRLRGCRALGAAEAPWRWAPRLVFGRGASSLAPTAGAAAAAAPSERQALPADGLTLADFLPGAGSVGTGASALRPPPVRKPKWLKMYNPNLSADDAERYQKVRATIKDSGLATVCQEARCPNVGECWSGGTATVMIMGDTCTRGCRFCSVATSRAPPPVDAEEPRKLAETVEKWGLDYIVLTMVDRDDLPDQGAAHIVATVQELKRRDPALGVETLVGDFQGQLELVEQVANSGMEVFAHNVETVERLTRTVRDRRAGYQQSLGVLRHARASRPSVVTKSSIMLGLGEEFEEVHQALRDLKHAGVEIVTFGQYLQPTKRHMKVTRYVEPQEFDDWRLAGEALGLHVASGPLVRSSYRAGEFFKERLARRAAAEGASRPVDLGAAWGAGPRVALNAALQAPRPAEAAPAAADCA